MRGYFASLTSLRKKRPSMRRPNTMRQSTLGDVQGNSWPPKSRPSSVIKVTPRSVILPNQSMARMPSQSFVLGLWTFRENKIIKKARPHIGKFRYL